MYTLSMKKAIKEKKFLRRNGCTSILWACTKRKPPWKAPCQHASLNKPNKQPQKCQREIAASIIN